MLLSRFNFLKRPGLHVVHIASEMVPVAKVGGLGDVVAGLAKAHQQRLINRGARFVRGLGRVGGCRSNGWREGALFIVRACCADISSTLITVLSHFKRHDTRQHPTKRHSGVLSEVIVPKYDVCNYSAVSELRVLRTIDVTFDGKNVPTHIWSGVVEG